LKPNHETTPVATVLFELWTPAVQVVLLPTATEEGWQETKNPGGTAVVVEVCPTFKVNATDWFTPPPFPMIVTW
jgi:hypothetical protein